MYAYDSQSQTQQDCCFRCDTRLAAGACHRCGQRTTAGFQSSDDTWATAWAGAPAVDDPADVAAAAGLAERPSAHVAGVSGHAAGAPAVGGGPGTGGLAAGGISATGHLVDGGPGAAGGLAAGGNAAAGLALPPRQFKFLCFLTVAVLLVDLIVSIMAIRACFGTSLFTTTTTFAAGKLTFSLSCSVGVYRVQCGTSESAWLWQQDAYTGSVWHAIAAYFFFPELGICSGTQAYAVVYEVIEMIRGTFPREAAAAVGRLKRRGGGHVTICLSLGACMVFTSLTRQAAGGTLASDFDLLIVCLVLEAAAAGAMAFYAPFVMPAHVAPAPAAPLVVPLLVVPPSGPVAP